MSRFDAQTEYWFQFLCAGHFLASHFPLHDGVPLKSLKEKIFYWPAMDKDVQEFLTQRACTKNKLEKFTQKPHGEGITCTISHKIKGFRSPCITCTSTTLNFTLLHLFADFPCCIDVAYTGESEVKRLLTNFAQLTLLQKIFSQTTGNNFRS